MKESYLLRSMMFVPGHNQRLIDSAARSEADAIILDIEDSVMPDSNKEIARNTIYDRVSKGDLKNYYVFPRINDRESGFLLKDVYKLTIEGITGFVYPKARTGQDIYFFDKLLETIEFEKGFECGHFKIVPLIETTAAVLNVQDICQASDRVIAIAYGCEDFITDLQGIHDNEGNSLFVPRAMIAMGARAHGIIPIDTVHINIHDLEDLEKNLILSKDLGFEGMLILHPKELPLAHQYYTPSDEEFRKAEEILRLSKEAEKLGKGVALMEGHFIGPPMVLSARKLLKKRELISRREG